MDWRRRSRIHLAAFVAVIAAAFGASALATADKPVTGPGGFPGQHFGADFSPKKLSGTRSEPTPIALEYTFFRKAVDEQPLPALRKLAFEGDKHVVVDVRKIPTCGPGVLSIRLTPAQLREMCRPALVGNGRMKTVVEFPDLAPITLESDVIAINGGVKGGVTTIYLHTYFTAPVTGWVVTTVKIKKIRRGRYGFEAIASVPKIAGGAGAVTAFRLSLKRDVASAACLDGRLNTQGTAVFADGTSSYGTSIRTCSATRG